MKTIKHLSVLLFFIGASHALKASESGSGKLENTITYKIAIQEDHQRIAKVSLSFFPKDSTLYMTHGANNLPDRWASFVKNIRAQDDQGESIPLKYLGDARWSFPKELKSRITINYDLHLDHEEHSWSGGLDGVAYSTDWGVFYTGRALFVFHAADWEHIEVHFQLPENWKVTTPWKPIDSSKRSFIPSSQSAVMQSMIFAGTHKELSFKRDAFELVFALGGKEVISKEEKYQRMADGVLDYYIDLMGGLPNPAPDNQLDKSVVIINTSDQTDGEVIGNNISILLEKQGGPMSQLIADFLFAHEFFHLWNGKSIVPDDDETEWFKEGFSNYYTCKALYNIGIIKEETYYQVLNNLFFQRYITDEGLGSIALTQGEEKHAHWGIIYGGGLFVAIAQDIAIRQTSNNSRSIDHLMRDLFKRYGGTHDHYSLEDLLERLSELNGQDQSAFFKKYIQGKEQLPIEEYLNKAGLNAAIKEGQLLIENDPRATSLEQAIKKGMLGKKMDP